MATLTVYPDPNVETSTVDGWTRRNVFATPQTFNDLMAGAGTDVNDITTTDQAPQINSFSTSGNYYRVRRCIFLFDTSSLTSGATISDAVLSIKIGAKSNGFSTAPDYDIVSSTTASNTSLATGDHTGYGTTAFASIAYASLSTSVYNDFTLDANGIANISKTSISKFGARWSWDRTSTEPTWVTNTAVDADTIFADTANTTSDPKLVITYTVAVGPANLKTYNTNATANIKSINTNLIANSKSLNTNV